MRILVLNGGTGTVKAALATATGQGVTVDSRYSVEAGSGRISTATSPPVYVMRTDEELHIARAVARALPPSSPR
jgi:acetate kinase